MIDSRTIEEQGFSPFNELANGLCIKKGRRYNQAISKGYEPADYDDEPFVKVFPGGMGSMYQLSLSGYRLMMVVIECVSEQARHTDEIYLNLKIAREKLSREGINLSETSWQRARDQLVELKILLKETKSSKGIKYLINPTVIFNGNRTKYMKSLIEECRENGWYDHTKNTLMLDQKIDEAKAEIQRIKISLKELKQQKKEANNEKRSDDGDVDKNVM